MLMIHKDIRKRFIGTTVLYVNIFTLNTEYIFEGSVTAYLLHVDFYVITQYQINTPLNHGDFLVILYGYVVRVHAYMRYWH